MTNNLKLGLNVMEQTGNNCKKNLRVSVPYIDVILDSIHSLTYSLPPSFTVFIVCLYYRYKTRSDIRV